MTETYLSHSNDYPFLKGGGEMGELTRRFPWDKTVLGNPGTWPQSLKTTLSIILNSKFPMFLWWGTGLTCFYNDAYRPSLGRDGKHPSILGMSAAEAWPEIWDIIKPLIDQVLSGGEATWSEDQLIPIYRNGQLEDVYWTFSYSPVTDESGKPAGVFVTCTETTGKVIAYQQLEENNNQLRDAIEATAQAQKKIKENERNLLLIIMQAPVAIAIFRGPEYIVEISNSRALELWGREEADVLNKPIMEAMPELQSQGIKELLDHVYTTGEPFSASGLPVRLLRGGEMETAYINFVYEPLYDVDGEINGLITIGTEITNQFLERKAIEESEERFRTMAEGTDILIAVGDENGNASYFNKAWTDLTGKSTEDLLGLTWTELVHPDDREGSVGVYLSSFKEKIPFSYEFRVFDNTGGYRWLTAKGQPRFRPDGTFAGYISSCVDITERKQHQRELMASEEKLNNILSQLPMPIVVLRGPEQVIETTNESLLAYWGKTKGEVVGKPILEVFPEFNQQSFPQEWKRVLEKGETITFREKQVMHNNPDGSTRLNYVDYYYQPLTDATGNRTSVLATAVDVTDKVESRRQIENTTEELQVLNEEMTAFNEELKTTNEELAETQESLQRVINRLTESEEKLRQAIETGKMGTWSFDPIGLTVTLSAFVKQLFGLPQETEPAIGEMMSAVDPGYQQMIRDVLGNAIKSNEPSDIEYPINNLITGERKWIRATGRVFRDVHGKVTQYSGLVMDITERKQDELRKNDFIGMVSHELKTPLTSLTAIVQVANTRLKNSEDTFMAGAMDKASIQVKKMTTMINGFLNISRLESGKISVIKQNFLLNELIKDLISEALLVSSGHKIVFVHSDLVILYADADKIGSVITNLLSNAIKYSPKGSTIEVKCSMGDNMALVSVKDEGIGIKPDDVDKLFDRYYRVETKQTAHISGFGIGLYLSAEIIKRHDGSIWAESEPGKGSTFYFSLPLSAEL